MGLSKEITAPNGIPLNYHRITSITIITNVQNIVEVSSYTSQEKREEERAMIEALASGDNEASCDVYIDTEYISMEYDPDMTVASAYGAIKELDKYSDAEDVFEEPNHEEGAVEG